MQCPRFAGADQKADGVARCMRRSGEHGAASCRVATRTREASPTVETRTEKLARLQDEVRRGTYRPDLTAVAEALIRSGVV